MGVIFWIDLENSAGDKLGSGPITSASVWRYTARMDRAGSFSFTMPASDPKAAEVQKKRIARAWAHINDAWVEIGAGIIDNIVKTPNADGTVTLQVSGDSEERELNYRSVGFLELADTNDGILHNDAVDAIATYAPAGWVLEPDHDPGNDFVYARFAGESVLQAAIKIADKCQTHFYRSGERTLTFESSFAPSGIRAIQARNALVPETCAIVSLNESIDTYDLITRIYPYGAGQGQARLTLAATSRTAPAGYTLDAVNNYIESTSAAVTYGQIEQFIEYKDVAPLSNTDADLEAAANMLFDVALEELQRRSTELEQATYKVKLAQCSTLLRPMQTIRLVYRDADSDMAIDADLNILEATIEITPSEIRTTDLQVSTADRWAVTDVDAIVGSMMQGQIFSAHPQMGPSAPILCYNKNVDADEMATFRFRLGSEIVTLQQTLFEFQLLPFESTVKTIAGATSGSGTIVTTVPSTNTSNVPSNNTSGTPSNNTSDVPSNNTSGEAAGNTGEATGDTGDSGTLTTDEPTGGDTDISGYHQHAINVIAGAGSLGNVSLHESGGVFFLSNPFVTGFEPVYVSPNGLHEHNLDPHVHDLDSHTHSLGDHTHSLNDHTHSLQDHTHGLGDHTHDLNNHTHDLSESLTAIYGIFRETDERTYAIGELEYQVNSGAWADLDEAEDVGDGWYALDITSQVQNSTNYRPLQANNTIKVRPKTGVLTIDSWGGGALDALSITTSIAHGIDGSMLPLTIKIEGAAVGTLGSNINGDWTLVSASGTTLIATGGTVAFGDANGTPAGTVTPQLTATIDAQLSIRNTIQAIAYT